MASVVASPNANKEQVKELATSVGPSLQGQSFGHTLTQEERQHRKAELLEQMQELRKEGAAAERSLNRWTLAEKVATITKTGIDAAEDVAGMVVAGPAGIAAVHAVRGTVENVTKNAVSAAIGEKTVSEALTDTAKAQVGVAVDTGMSFAMGKLGSAAFNAVAGSSSTLVSNAAAKFVVGNQAAAFASTTIQNVSETVNSLSHGQSVELKHLGLNYVGSAAGALVGSRSMPTGVGAKVARQAADTVATVAIGAGQTFAEGGKLSAEQIIQNAAGVASSGYAQGRFHAAAAAKSKESHTDHSDGVKPPSKSATESKGTGAEENSTLATTVAKTVTVLGVERPLPEQHESQGFRIDPMTRNAKTQHAMVYHRDGQVIDPSKSSANLGQLRQETVQGKTILYSEIPRPFKESDVALRFYRGEDFDHVAKVSGRSGADGKVNPDLCSFYDPESKSIVCRVTKETSLDRPVLSKDDQHLLRAAIDHEKVHSENGGELAAYRASDRILHANGFMTGKRSDAEILTALRADYPEREYFRALQECKDKNPHEWSRIEENLLHNKLPDGSVGSPSEAKKIAAQNDRALKALDDGTITPAKIIAGTPRPVFNTPEKRIDRSYEIGLHKADEHEQMARISKVHSTQQFVKDIKNASPIPIPKEVNLQVEDPSRPRISSHGIEYLQKSWKFESGNAAYEVRWHTRTTSSQLEKYGMTELPGFRVDRKSGAQHFDLIDTKQKGSHALNDPNVQKALGVVQDSDGKLWLPRTVTEPNKLRNYGSNEPPVRQVDGKWLKPQEIRDAIGVAAHIPYIPEGVDLNK